MRPNQAGGDGPACAGRSPAAALDRPTSWAKILQTGASTLDSSFIRWQGRTIEQLGAVNNTFSALALAILGLMGSWIESDPPRYGWSLIAAEFTLCFAGISAVIGAALAWNRLLAFRLTARVARRREKGHGKGLNELRKRVRVHDSVTWWLLACQIAFFALSLMALVAAMGIR